MNKCRSISASVYLAVLCSGCTAIVDQFSGRGEACQILAIGKPAKATIIDISDTGVTINKDPVVAFYLEVQPEQGPPFRAKTEALVSRLDVPQVQPGKVLPVKFDPQQQSRVAIDAWDCGP
jgi:hypothetical protein